MITYYITRHGQTIMNNQRLYQGALDSPLSQEGIEAVTQLSNALADITFDAVYCSPLGRTKQTAAIILKEKSNNIIYCDDLVELDFGILEGKPIESFENDYPKEFESLYKNPDKHIPVPKMEHIKDFHHRIERCFNSIEQHHQSGNILIVCHGLVVRSLLKIMKNRDWNQYWVDGHVAGASLSVVTKKNQQFQIILENDTSHMNHIPSD